MNTDNFSWNEFSHGIYLDADLPTVFKFLATAEGITKWFIAKAEYFTEDKKRAPGDIAESADSFRWKWQNKDLEITGKVLSSIKEKEFVFTFGSLFEAGFYLSQEKGRTKLVLRQSYGKDSQKDEFGFLNCCVCWVFFLTNLKSVVENGNDLRETQSQEEFLVNL